MGQQDRGRSLNACARRALYLWCVGWWNGSTCNAVGEKKRWGQKASSAVLAEERATWERVWEACCFLLPSASRLPEERLLKTAISVVPKRHDLVETRLNPATHASRWDMVFAGAICRSADRVPPGHNVPPGTPGAKRKPPPEHVNTSRKAHVYIQRRRPRSSCSLGLDEPLRGRGRKPAQVRTWATFLFSCYFSQKKYNRNKSIEVLLISIGRPLLGRRRPTRRNQQQLLL